MKISELINNLQKQIKNQGDLDISIDFNSELYQYLNPLEPKANKFKISIGDWSQDGHNQFNEYYYWSTTPLVDIQNAFKESCRKYGLIFDSNNNFNTNTEYTSIFNDYEDDKIDAELLKHLENIGIDITKYFDYDEKAFMLYKNGEENKFYDVKAWFDDPVLMPDFVMDVAKLSLDFNYEPAPYIPNEKIKPFNGWWTDNEMNISIGYGLYWS